MTEMKPSEEAKLAAWIMAFMTLATIALAALIIWTGVYMLLALPAFIAVMGAMLGAGWKRRKNWRTEE